MSVDDTLAEVELLDREATEGPWQWFGNTDVHSCYLATTHSGRMYVLDFARWGMGDAQPRFRWPVGANAGIMYPLAKMPAECGPRFEVEYRRDFTGINHPDAALIAYYRTACPELAAEVTRLRAELAEARAETETYRANCAAAELEGKRLRNALNRDKTGLAAALVEVRKAADGYRWIADGEWGSYSWEEHTVETLQRETGWALGSIEDIARKALEASGTLATKAIQSSPATGDER